MNDDICLFSLYNIFKIYIYVYVQGSNFSLTYEKNMIIVKNPAIFIQLNYLLIQIRSWYSLVYLYLFIYKCQRIYPVDRYFYRFDFYPCPISAQMNFMIIKKNCTYKKKKRNDHSSK